MAETTHTREELVYAPAIVILADDLYPRKLEIVREYIQNASDALDAFSRIASHIGDDTKPQIKISVQGKSLLIFDNGIGMDVEDVSKLKRIAYSEKREGQEAGYKGIGRLAGIAVANKLMMSSTCYGDPKLHKFEFRAGDLHQDIADNRKKGVQEPASTVINRHTSITTLDTDPTDHFTIVELRDIDDRHADLLDPIVLRRFIGDIGPVGFAPDFFWGNRISDRLYQHVPDYSPKSIWLSNNEGDRSEIYKPYNDLMRLAEPEFYEIPDPHDGNRLLAYCWTTTRGQDMLGKVRPTGKRFTIDGKGDDKKSLAGPVYKLFGFSVGDRSLPLRTLWRKDYTRALWFTGEIHIVDKEIKPTTDRSNFVENAARSALYLAGRERVAKRLDLRAQVISDDRKAWEKAEEYRAKFQNLRSRLDKGDVERAELKAIRAELHQAEKELSRTCKDHEVLDDIRNVNRERRDLLSRLDASIGQKNKTSEINDLAREVEMTTQSRKLYTIIMEVLENHFGKDLDTYYELSGEIKNAIRKRFSH